MGLRDQLANVVEWEQYNDDIIFWKWKNREIKKGSRLIIQPGQDAIFLYNGRTEGIFRDEGSFDIESQIIPFLSTLKGFKFGFNSGIRAEVLFINTKEMTEKWGTKNPINIPAPGLPGGMPVRAFGTFTCKVADDQILMDKIAGAADEFTLADVKARVMSNVDQLLMKWIVREGKDMFHLQAYATDISKGIAEDLDYQMRKIGIAVTDFTIASVSYPEEVQKMAEKAASQSMIGDIGKYQQVAMADALSNGGNGGSAAADMAGMAAGLAMGQQMINQMNGQTAASAGQAGAAAQTAAGAASAVGGAATGPKFCPNCGTPTNGAKFCTNCGTKLI
ncbi:MAG: SPFH domain-containing protein [Eubacterium sp.]|nr:SPFH domain-containing protein [Eubacterium sp.]